MGREEKEVRCLRKYTYISKKKAELNALRENCALKIITFRYFAFFVELPVFFTINSFYIFFVHDFFRYARAYRAYR